MRVNVIVSVSPDVVPVYSNFEDGEELLINIQNISDKEYIVKVQVSFPSFIRYRVSPEFLHKRPKRKGRYVEEAVLRGGEALFRFIRMRNIDGRVERGTYLAYVIISCSGYDYVKILCIDVRE